MVIFTHTVIMVQEVKSCYHAVRSSETRDPAAKKAGYDAVRRAEEERKRLQQLSLDKEKQAKQAQSSGGAWGPVFKNRQHFNSLHIC